MMSRSKICAAERGVDFGYGQCARRDPVEVPGLKLGDQGRKTRSVLEWEMHENVPAVELSYMWRYQGRFDVMYCTEAKSECTDVEGSRYGPYICARNHAS